MILERYPFSNGVVGSSISTMKSSNLLDGWREREGEKENLIATLNKIFSV